MVTVEPVVVPTVEVVTEVPVTIFVTVEDVACHSSSTSGSLNCELAHYMWESIASDCTSTEVQQYCNEPALLDG